MKQAEKILRENIIEIVEFGKDGNNVIRYDDALKAVEVALGIKGSLYYKMAKAIKRSRDYLMGDMPVKNNLKLLNDDVMDAYNNLPETKRPTSLKNLSEIPEFNLKGGKDADNNSYVPRNFIFKGLLDEHKGLTEMPKGLFENCQTLKVINWNVKA